MHLEVGDPEIFKRHIAPFLPSSDYYELRSRFDNLRDTLPVTRYMNWPSVVQEIVNADLSWEEAEILSHSLRISPINNMDDIVGCWSLVLLFLQNETCADCVKRSFLVLPVLHAAMTDRAVPIGRLEDLMLSHTSMVVFVGLYCEDYNLIQKLIHITRKDRDDESFLKFSVECFAGCVLFDKLDFFKRLLKNSLILPIHRLGTAQGIFTTIMSPTGLAALEEPIPNNPFVPANIRSWFDFVIDDSQLSLPGELGAMILEFGCIRSAIYFVEERRVLIGILHAAGSSYANFLEFAQSFRDTNSIVVEYFENLPYAKMIDMSILSACAFDELALVRILLESTDPNEIDFDACINALSDPVFTLERRNTDAIRDILTSKRPKIPPPPIISQKKRSKRYCCY